MLIIIKCFVRFLMAYMTHWNTHVHIWRRHRTHTHTRTRTRRPEVAVNLFSAFFLSWTVLPPGPPRSSGQLVSARGPSEPSALVRDGKECSVHRQDELEARNYITVVDPAML